MINLSGKHNEAKIFSDHVEEEALAQIKTICDLPFLKNSKIRIMPDVHTGIGATIGTTMTITDVVIPNLVGVDIGCGMEVCKIEERHINFRELDEIITKFIPSGKDVRERKIVDFPDLKKLKCYSSLNGLERLECSIGSLGSGNHFIEVDRDDEGYLYIVVHSGSRNLGKQVAKIYQDLAYDILKGKDEYIKERDALISSSSTDKRKKKEIQKKLKELFNAYNKKVTEYPKDLAYLEGKYFDDYINDMKISQEFASENRKAMMDIIIKKMNLTVIENFTTIHNYIDFSREDEGVVVLRKGAVSAKKNEKLIIPINMRDGSLICIGKGNDDWNQSAPHGAGRIMSRKKAREVLNLEEFKKSMKGIYSSTVNISTLDEAPFAYKSINEILDNVQESVDVISVIKPLYNYKAGE